MKKIPTDNLLARLQRDIRSLMDVYADDIATGSCRDFAEYKRMSGVIEGLAYAERAILDLDQKMNEDG